VVIEQVQQLHPVLDELRVDPADCLRCGRGAETGCGPGARAKKAPMAEGIHVFFRFVLGAPA
jgi:hypothetical protein